ncbi:MAG: hypothetical protein RR825_08120, partial [Ruthenibacterium sp.]
EVEHRPAQTASPFAFAPSVPVTQDSIIPDSLRNPYAPVPPPAAQGFGAVGTGAADYAPHSAAQGFGAVGTGVTDYAPHSAAQFSAPAETVDASFAPVPSGVAGAGLYTGAGSSSIAVPPTGAPLQQGENASFYVEQDPLRVRLATERLVPVPAAAADIHRCPECGGPVEHEGGCVICRNCGFSKCG